MSNRQPTLAELIRKSSEDAPVEDTLETSQAILARITDGIYRQPASALRELISNAYDADATEVQILTDAPRFGFISVRDNGIGFSPETLDHMVHNIGSSAKRTPEGVELHMAKKGDPSFSDGGRKLIGKMGIGLFAVAQFTRHFLIITKTKGDRFRTIADVTLKTGGDGQEGSITTGHVKSWRIKATDIDVQGTEIRLLDLLPRTKQELYSFDRWNKIDYEREVDQKVSTPKPKFHIGRVDPKNPDEILERPSLPWDNRNSPRRKFELLVEKVRELAGTDASLVDLEGVCDNYFLTLWSLALSAPLDYVDAHPFDLAASRDFKFFQLENKSKGQAKALSFSENQTPRELLNLEAPFRQADDEFKVYVDGIQLLRPIRFRDQLKTQHALKSALLFIGRCRHEFADKPVELSGGPLEFEGYLLWTPKVSPTQHQGIVLRVGDAAGTPFDRTFMGYQVSEQTRLRQITGEIFVRQGLDRAINLDRESFNFAHPHYQFLVKWLHSAIRQLTNKQKELAKSVRESNLATQGAKASKQLEKRVRAMLEARGVQDVPDVVLVDPLDGVDIVELRESGTIVLSRSVVLPDDQGRTSRGSQVHAFNERKAIAVATILQSWGLLETLPYADQEQMIREILEVAFTGFDQ